ncbi:MAG: PP2C family protein-serine/threonine phosphatase [Candidatus Kapabacteria bacterium]|nr:PP2C family protein-serine/threonine phosphatase [Candidatus Kapabacteria bacterium]
MRVEIQGSETGTDQALRAAAIGIGVLTATALLARIAIVSWWCVTHDLPLSAAAPVEITTSILADLVLAGFAGIAIVTHRRKRQTPVTYDTVAGAMSLYAMSALVLLLISGVIPLGLVDGVPQSIASAVFVNILAAGFAGITIGMATAVVHVLLGRPHRRTRRYLGLQLALIVCVWAAAALSPVFEGLDVVGVILVITGALVLLLNIRRLHWITVLTIDKKLRLLWLALCAGFAAAVLMAQSGGSDGSGAAQSMDLFVRGGLQVLAVVNLYVLLFVVRVFVATVAALPNSGIVDRRSTEVESLSHVTKLVAESASVEELLTSVTQLSQQVCRAHGAWCETYDVEGLHCVAAQLVHSAYVTSVHNDHELHRLILSCDAPMLIDDVRQRLPDSDVARVLRSLILVPIRRDHRRHGTLVIFSTVPFGFEQDDVRVAAAFGDTVSVALDQARLSDASRERERMHREFEMAQRIQASLLPARVLERPGVDVDAVMIPATEVGGDYFDYITFANGKPGVIIADVAGKGVPAALYMATLKGVVLAAARTSTGPGDLLRRVNATLHGSMQRSTFITIACVEIDIDHHTLRLARAGHTPAIVRTSQGVRTVCPSGMAIGIVGSQTFDEMLVEENIPVQPGDICLLTTDGVTERLDGARAEIPLERITECIGAMEQPAADAVVRSVLALLDDHANGAEAHDDITIAAIVVQQTSQPTTDHA